MPVFRRNRIHEIHLVWETGLVAEIRDVLLGKQHFAQERAGGSWKWFDRWIEKATGAAGRGVWSEMRSDAKVAFDRPLSAGRIILEALLDELRQLPESKRPKLHLAGHSAGSLLLGHLLSDFQQLQASASERFSFENLTLFAPACTHTFFEDKLKQALAGKAVDRLHHFHLDEKSELQDSVAKIYRKSLLYLVSRAYERKGEVVPLMGMAKYLKQLPTEGVNSRIRHYDNSSTPHKTTSIHHGEFDNNEQAMNSLLEVILGQPSNKGFEADELKGY
jgi:hypothetical protein